MNAYTATILVSIIPNILLYVIPQSFINSIHGIKYLLCMASGSLLGDVFLHALPHLFMNDHHHQQHEEDHKDEHNRGLFIGGAVLIGIMTFMMSERLISIFLPHHDHDHENDHKQDDNDSPASPTTSNLASTLSPQGWLNLAADSLHNFTDGIAMAVAYRAGHSIGWATFLSVMVHEIPHELADFSILVSNGMSKFGAIRLQFLTALAALLGVFVGNIVTENNKFLEDMLVAGTAGGFIYIGTIAALASVINSKRKVGFSQMILELLFFSIGVSLMLVVSQMEQHEHDSDNHHHGHMNIQAADHHDHGHHHDHHYH